MKSVLTTIDHPWWIGRDKKRGKEMTGPLEFRIKYREEVEEESVEGLDRTSKFLVSSDKSGLSCPLFSPNMATRKDGESCKITIDSIL